ncbi:hypothetical protein AM10699_17530 [Acaryochloris marina MBIC10699]|nr:hypothetical protein AM10699_17530 [Acaryochloris marina MBIC10699]
MGANLSDSDLIGAYLSGADLRDSDLSGANLREVNLSDSDLSDSDLSDSDLSRANLSGSGLIGADLRDSDLIGAYLSGTDLIGADLSDSDLARSNFSDANLRGVDLSCSNLSNANLRDADLSNANLSNTNFSGANLSGANLSNANLLNSKLRNALLTRACIQDWKINAETDFAGVVCEYIYLKASQQERRPLTENFGLDEFAALVQTSLESIDLIFVDGIDWRAFLQSFQKLCSQFGDQAIGIQAIERKGEELIIRLEGSLAVDKSVIETTAKENYSRELQRMEASYKAQLQTQEDQLQHERQRNSQLLRIVEVMSEHTGP